MPNAPTPAAPLATGAGSSQDSKPDFRPGELADDRFELPDLCTPVAVFGVVLACQVLAVLLALARQPNWPAFYDHLAQVALILLWIGLLSAATLCRLRTWLRRFDVVRGSVVTFLLVMAVVLLVSEASFWLGRFLGSGLAGPGGWFPAEHWSFITRNLAIGAIVMAPVLRYFYISTQWQRNVRRQAAARLVALQARIRPHFLFNSMNTIAALTRSSPEAAEQAVEDLADLFRASLSEARQLIPLGEELEVARVYQRMEQHRLGPRLRVDWALGDLPEDALIPGLTLQPLLENAIYHGIEPSVAPGRITVRGARQGTVLRISVENPLPPRASGNPRNGNRMALDNIRERLELAFGREAGLELESGPDSFTATISFPCRTGGGP